MTRKERMQMWLAYSFAGYATFMLGWHIIDKIVKFSTVSEQFPTYQFM